MAITRRELFILAPWALAAATVGVWMYRRGGGDGSVSQGLPHTLGELTIDEWSKLSAIEQIDRFEYNKIPKAREFDKTRALIQAVAQLYCQSIRCQATPEDLVSAVSFVSRDELIFHLEKENNRKFSEEEKRDEAASQLEVVTHYDGDRVLINDELFTQVLEDIRINQPEILQKLDGRDLPTVVLKSLLIHAFTHVNRSKDSLAFDGFSVKLPRSPGPINFDMMDGFKIIGVQSDGLPAYMTGADEAITEYAAIVIGKEAGVYLSLVPEYHDGAVLVGIMNQRAGIRDEEYLQYVDGERPLEDFLARWGSLTQNSAIPKEKNAILILATIGLRVHNAISQQEARNAIEERMAPP